MHTTLNPTPRVACWITRAVMAGAFFVATQPDSSAEDLKLKNGKVFSNVTGATDAGDKVKIMHDAGIAAVAKKDVPEEFMTAHGISLDATPPMPAAQPAAPSGGSSAPAGVDKEERKLTALSIIGSKGIPVELEITNYENGTFVGQAVFIQMTKQQQNVNGRFNGLQRQMIYDTAVVDVPVPWHLIAPLRVYGLPKTVATGPKQWRGVLWIGWMRDGEREAFTSKELALQHMVERGPGTKVKLPEFVEQTEEYLIGQGLWRGPDTVLPKPTF